jgi:O-antigen/teichoic acid export membrane protein
MSLPANLIKGGLQVGLGQVGQQGLLLIRSVFVARLLPEQQFGIAQTFMTVIAALDAMTEIGIEIYIVSNKDQDSEDLQRTLHTMLILRGLVSAIGIYLLAHPVALLFGVPDSAWAYQWLAIVPLIRGFVHLDYKRYERTFRYWPGILVAFVSTLANALISVVIAWKTGSPIAIVIGYAVQMVVMVLGSHMTAERSYGLAFVTSRVKELIAFGSPLILNGVLIYVLSQGDRIVIGSMLGLRALENYAVVAILSAGITILVMRVTDAVYLPLLSDAKVGTPTYLTRYEASGAFTVLTAIATLMFFGFVGHSFVTLAFGQKFSPTPLLVTLLGIQVALKLLRTWPQRAFLANAQTSILFYSNLIAATGLVFAFYAAQYGYGIEGVAAGIVISELIAVLHSVFVVGRIPGAAVIGWKFMALIVTTSAGLLAMQWHSVAPDGFISEMLVGSLAGLMCVSILMWMSPVLSQFIRTMWKTRQIPV